jgi:regulator of protease activity HflC (stomatin/prohibitin superfamily)
VSDVLAEHAAEELLAGGGEALGAELVRRVQQSFDQHRAGVEVVSVVMLGVRPPSLEVTQAAIDVDMARQNRLKTAAEAEATAATVLTMTVGDAAKAGPIIAAIDQYESLGARHGTDSPAASEAREQADRLISQAGGMVASLLSAASRDRWVAEMQARGRAERLLGQLPAYRAAPRLYRERRVMELFANALRPIRKYVVAIDPSLVALDVEFKELNPLLTSDLTTPSENSAGTNP